MDKTSQLINPQQILVYTLSLVDYQGNKKAYADKFLRVCQEQIFATLLENLPEEKQESLVEEVKAKKYKDLRELIEKNFPSEKIFEVSKEVTQKSFAEILQEIIPLLSKEQKTKLDDYLKSLNKK